MGKRSSAWRRTDFARSSSAGAARARGRGGGERCRGAAGTAGRATRAHRVALAGEACLADEAEAHGQTPFLGEVYEDVEGAGDAFAVAGQVAGPGLLDSAPPGGVVAQAYQGGVARVALVELQGEAVGFAFCEALHQDGRGALRLGGVPDQDEGLGVVLFGELVERS